MTTTSSQPARRTRIGSIVRPCTDAHMIGDLWIREKVWSAVRVREFISRGRICDTNGVVWSSWILVTP